MPLQAGAVIGNYIVGTPLGMGTYATVYSVRDALTNAVCAMKVCHNNQGQTPHLTRVEINVLLRISESDPNGQKNCVSLLNHFDLSNGFTCLVFPLLGRSLLSFLRNNNNIPFPRFHVQKIARQILIALEFIHSIGIVHCDVKSDNILLTDNRYFLLPHPTLGVMRKVMYEPQIRLSDFGISRIIIGRKQTDAVEGPFLSPETCLKLPWDYGVDIYAAGLIIHEIASGRHFIPAGSSPATTLTLLHAYKGPLPQNLARHAKQATNIPFENARSMSVLPCRRNSTQINFEGLGVRRSDVMNLAIRSRQHDVAMSADTGGAMFVNLTDRLLEYDPAKRIKATDALRHPYFTVRFQQPVAPGVHRY